MIGVVSMFKISINGAVLLNDGTMEQVTSVTEHEGKIDGTNEQIVSAITGKAVSKFWGSVTQVAVTYSLDWSKIREQLGEQVKALVDSLPNKDDFYKTSSGNTSVTNGSKGGSYADRAKHGYYDSYKIGDDGQIVFGKTGQYPNTTTSDIVSHAISNGSIQKPALITAIKERFGVASQE